MLSDPDKELNYAARYRHSSTVHYLHIGIGIGIGIGQNTDNFGTD